MAPPLVVHDLGVRRFAEVLELQRACCRARGDGTLDHDLLLLVQHPSVYTFGRGTKAESLPLPPAQLADGGRHDVVEIERGGDVTWHGPGQLVGYPILHLSRLREDLHWYLREVEQSLIDALATLDVAAERAAGRTGVWTGGRKIASIGIHVKRWVTMHGFALNVVNDLAPFTRIVPCGITGVEMTSIAAEHARSRSAVSPGPETFGAALATGSDARANEALLHGTMRAVTAALADRFGHTPQPATVPLAEELRHVAR